MEVCHLFHDKTVNDEDKRGPKRKCMTVRSCANHSQCFPTDSDQERMRISSNAFTIRPRKVDDGYSESKSALGTQIRDHGFTMQYGGMEHTTRCCVNRNNFRPTIDTPCNAGVRARWVCPSPWSRSRGMHTSAHSVRTVVEVRDDCRALEELGARVRVPEERDLETAHFFHHAVPVRTAARARHHDVR